MEQDRIPWPGGPVAVAMEDILERSHRPRFDPVSTIPKLFTGGPAEAIVAQDAAGTTSATRDGDPVGRVDPGWQHVSIAGNPVWWLNGVDLPGALATTGAAHHHGNALRRAADHLAGSAIGPKRRRRYRRLLARGER